MLNAQSTLPLDVKEINFPGQRHAHGIKITPLEKSGCSIWIESKYDRKQWSQDFPDLSKCCETSGIQIPNEMVLSSMIQTILSLKITKNAGEEGKPTMNGNVGKNCSFEIVEGNANISITIPFGVTSITYLCSLEPVVLDEIEILRMKCIDIEEASSNQDKEVGELRKDFGELKTEFKEFKSKIEAFLFRDSQTLKERGFSSFQLKQAGFSSRDILKAWTKDDLKTDGYFNPLKLTYNSGQHNATLCRLTNDSRTVTAITTDGHRYVTSEEPLPHDCVSTFKVTIQKLTGWIGIGLIGIPTPKRLSYNSETCYSWAISSQVWIDGEENEGYGKWTGFEERDEAFFRYDPDTLILTMKVKARNVGARLGKHAAFSMKCAKLIDAYLHINMYSCGDSAIVAEMSQEEEAMYFSEVDI